MSDHILQKFELTYSPEQLGEMTELEFHVPEYIETIIVDIDDHAKTNFLDYSLRSPQGFHGWSGCSKTKFIVSEEYSTPGYLPTTPPGTWKLVVGFAKVTEHSTANITITLQLKTEKWYCGDLHMHSINSDGDYPIVKVMHNAYLENLDFIALTDHNTFTQNSETASTNRKLTVLPGIEITTYAGHFNIINLEKKLDKVLCFSQEEVDAVMAEGLDGHTVVSINHPFCADKWGWNMEPYPLDFIEIWNSGWKEGNLDCIHYWQEKLSQGLILRGIGGSDTHRDDGRWYGRPTTWVYAKGRGRKDLINGLHTGRVCVTLNPNAPHLDLSIGETSMGDIYHKNNEEQLTLTCLVMGSHHCELRLFGSDGLVQIKELNPTDEEVSFLLPADSLFYRAELWPLNDSNNEPLCFSNPVYIR